MVAELLGAGLAGENLVPLALQPSAALCLPSPGRECVCLVVWVKAQTDIYLGQPSGWGGVRVGWS